MDTLVSQNQRKNLLELNAQMKAKEEELLRMKEVLEKTQHVKLVYFEVSMHLEQNVSCESI